MSDDSARPSGSAASGSASVGTQTRTPKYGAGSQYYGYPRYGGSSMYDDAGSAFQRIACIRYVRPMGPYDQCGGGCGYPPPRPPCFGPPGWGDPYANCYAGQFPPTNRVLIIPPRNNNLYRPSLDRYGSRRGSQAPPGSEYTYEYEWATETGSGSYDTGRS